jgi:hypothetical protein
MGLQTITLLIRTSNRPELFTRCLTSIRQQTYKDIHVIVGYDDNASLAYIPEDIHTAPVIANKGIPYYYDLYCNQLKTYVNEGWFMFLDDDDFLHSPTVLEELASHFEGPHKAIVCQFLRKGAPKPLDRLIQARQVIEGRIGLPCLVAHHSVKQIGKLDGYKAGDYRYVKTVTELVTTKFVSLVVVESDRRSNGKPAIFLP